MAHLTPDRKQVNARIVYWGVSGAGVSTNLRVIHQKLRADHRGELQKKATRLDPTTHYELLPIELGQVNGLRTQLHVVAVPGGPEHAPTRKQLLDRIDGLVFVVDSSASRADQNLASLAELRSALQAYGRSLAELPVVVQYNKRDQSDPYLLEDLHRRLAIPGAAVFEAVASEGKGVLQTLTTISKRVIRVLRESRLEPEAPAAPRAQKAPARPAAEPKPVRAPAPRPPVRAPEPKPLPRADVDLMEDAILAEADSEGAAAEQATRAAEQALGGPWPSASPKSGPGARIGRDFEIVSVGQASVVSPRSMRVPVVLGNPEGETITLGVTVALDPLLDGED